MHQKCPVLHEKQQTSRGDWEVHSCRNCSQTVYAISTRFPYRYAVNTQLKVLLDHDTVTMCCIIACIGIKLSTMETRMFLCLFRLFKSVYQL